MDIYRYRDDCSSEWDDLVATAFNGSFLFYRAYMDYHKSRFEDYSLMIYERGVLQAIIAGSIDNTTWTSHAGLTYGGLIMTKAMSQRKVIECLQSINYFLEVNGVVDIIYKPLPLIYYDKIYQNVEFGLTYLGYNCMRRDAATSIVLSERGRVTKGRKSSIKKALKMGVEIVLSDDVDGFFVIQDSNIKKKYDAKSVHSPFEMRTLIDCFSDNIRLYIAKFEGNLVAGALVYVNKNVMHLQYFAMTDVGESVSATDLLITHLLICCEEDDIKVFDFGISTEEQGMYLNEGLNKYKESFGGVTTLYEFYHKKTK